MNISATSLLEARERDGEVAEDRPEYVEEALTPDKRVGYRDGLPLVEPEGGVDPETRLGDDVGPMYEHYRRGDALLLPETGDFLRRLFESEHIESVSDAAAEVNTDESTVRKAADLHGIEAPTGVSESEETETIEELELPSGESIPLALLSDPPHRDKLVLAQLLSAGMSVEEISRYLSKELEDRVTPAEVREAAQEHNMLSGGDDRERVALPSETMQSGAGEPVSTPW